MFRLSICLYGFGLSTWYHSKSADYRKCCTKELLVMMGIVNWNKKNLFIQHFDFWFSQCACIFYGIHNLDSLLMSFSLESYASSYEFLIMPNAIFNIFIHAWSLYLGHSKPANYPNVCMSHSYYIIFDIAFKLCVAHWGKKNRTKVIHVEKSYLLFRLRCKVRRNWMNYSPQ